MGPGAGITPMVTVPTVAPSYAPQPAQQQLGALLTKEELHQILRGGRLPNFANASTGIYGISGSGKSRQVDMAIKFAAEIFSVTSHVNAVDLGGFSTERVAFIRMGLTTLYDPRNHVNPVETIEKLSRGAVPAYYDDPETGKAPPDVPLIEPRKEVMVMRCPSGHDVTSGDPVVVVNYQGPCPTCGIVTSAYNGTTRKVIIRPKEFATLGHWAFDSITEINDWTMQHLGYLSANNGLPKTASGGSLLGGAMALEEGSVSYGGGSMAQVGFVQNRTHQWLANIRAIPGQVIPATLTFAVEAGKADDDSGGVQVLGPQIIGKARTATVPRWLGACIHATREPDAVGNMRYRLWLVNHLDPRDPRRIPYLAKHRGIPAMMPEFLEDPWFDDEEQRKAAANTVCSLDTFYRLLIRQVAYIEDMNRNRLGELGEQIRYARDHAKDEVLGEVATAAPVVIPGQPGLGQPMPTVVRPVDAPVVVPNGPAITPTPYTAPYPATVPHITRQPQVPLQTPNAAAPVPLAAQAAKPVTQQLQESLVAQMPMPTGLRMPQQELRVPGQPMAPVAQAMPAQPMPVAPAPAAPPTPTPGPTARRTPRPPI